MFRSETGVEITNEGNEVAQEQVDEDDDVSPRCSPPRPVANQGI